MDVLIIVIAILAGLIAAAIGVGAWVYYNRPKIAAVPSNCRKAWHVADEFNINDCVEIAVDGDKEIRILQLTDIHYDMCNHRKEDTLRLIDQVINRAAADFIVVTGDWCSDRKLTREYSEIVFRAIDRHNVPWTVTCGNHDHEGTMTKYDIAEMLASCTNCVFEIGYTNIGGVGNGVVAFVDDVTRKTLGSIYLLDSHTAYIRHTTRYMPIEKRQIKWYRWAVQGMQKVHESRGGEGVLKSLVFCHIPLCEYKEMSTSGRVEYGVLGEMSFPSERNTGMYKAMKECGSSLAVFAGHDHANNAVMDCGGIKLVYGVQSGWCKGYADDSLKGGVLIALNGDTLKIEHIEYSDK